MTDASGSRRRVTNNRRRTDQPMPKTSKGVATANAVTNSDPEHDPSWRQSRWRSDLRRKLLNWFDRHARQMPWRSDPTPYRVWVSEIMLQQTQVVTVLPYFQRWMESYPTVADLAAANESDLMRQWEGLGYYRRVRSMHAAAKKIVQEHQGEFPTNYEDVLALPGVGRYTAGAVLSISMDAKFPVLEGNTQRVYSRWIALRTSPTQKPAEKLLWRFAERMLPPNGSGRFNQAAMELGALVCTPKKPDCDACPVRAHCRAAELGLQSEIPGKIKRIAYQDRTEFALLLSRQSRGVDQYLARPLPDDGRWAGLWDFPRCTDSATESVQSAAEWLAGELRQSIAAGVRLKTYRHAVTKYRISLHVHQASMAKSSARSKFQPPPPWRWVTLQQLQELPLSVTGRKIAKFLAEDDQSILPLS